MCPFCGAFYDQRANSDFSLRRNSTIGNGCLPHIGWQVGVVVRPFSPPQCQRFCESLATPQRCMKRNYIGR
ncbi:putative E3 ubiquitin-protein ligase HECTD2-like [Tropilaelaps mercedesae]|uniref:Putative E3 ubiquitin-protein ligase HECTD2-like n=1 Tax=Tropilaelaps mercedesae TaxID=418985 RepID=A0A1V9XV69_9ACAR|nr:putative E3 ubiquitin-protein ligase HECTD2-like [Tropilaelaps mercedesae]